MSWYENGPTALCQKYSQNHYRAELGRGEDHCIDYGIPVGSVGDRPWLPGEVIYRDGVTRTVSGSMGTLAFVCGR